MSPGVRIRPATYRDVSVLIALDTRAPDDPARAPFIDNALKEKEVFVADVDGAACGYGVLEYTFYDQGFISLVMVADARRRTGIASALMRRMESECVTEKLFTSTNESNAPMRALLEKLGYTPSGRIDNLDEDDPELVFVKKT